jgi:membrane-anchored mycosin MYCP
VYQTASTPLRTGEGSTEREYSAGGIMTIYPGRIEAFHDDQLIVAIPHLPIVTQALEALGVHWDAIDQSEPLGLARIRDLRDIGQAVTGLVGPDSDIGADLRYFREYQASIHGGKDAAHLEILIKGLHLRFAKEYPGWQVPIAKNYAQSWIVGHPHYGGGGQGNPQPGPAEFTLPQSDSGQGRGVRVGVLDTPLFPAQSLTGRYVARSGDLLATGQGQYTMFDGHCAFVCSCVLRRAPAAELHVRRVLDSDGSGSSWEAAEAMAEMAGQGLDVVNLSFGDYLTDDDTAPMVFKTAVDLFGPKTVVVAAAANNGNPSELTADLISKGITTTTASYPAAVTGVVGVGALDQNGNRALFTPNAPFIRLLAPGVGLTGAYVQGKVALQSAGQDGNAGAPAVTEFGGVAVWEGNSFAAAIVTGEIAARTLPGRRGPGEALDELLHPATGAGSSDIVPNP